MNRNKLNILFKFLILCVFLTNLYSHSRAAYSRPGSFIRTPSSIINKNSTEYYIGLSNEIINTNDLISSSSIYFHTTREDGFAFGLSYVKRAPLDINDTPPGEISFHVNKEIYSINNFIINMGVQDVLYHTKNENKISAFISLINKNIYLKNNFILQTAFGFGTGKINQDSYNYNSDNSISSDANFFAGVKIQTPLMKNKGRINLIADYDGNGTNIGLEIPATKNLQIKLGMTHFENRMKFNSFKNSSNQTIYKDSPGISLGIDIKIPQKNKEIQVLEEDYETHKCLLTIENHNYPNPMLLNNECDDQALIYLVEDINNMFNQITDSLLIQKQTIETAAQHNVSLEHQTRILKDSINIQFLNQHISRSEINIGMKFLANSLKYYYLEDYNLALQAVDQAEQYLPTLAYVYARKGSIYYKLGDIDRATINWNVALELDPEYTEVHSILQSIKLGQMNLEVLSN